MTFLLLLSLAKEGGGGGRDEMRAIESNGVRIAHLLEMGERTGNSCLVAVWISLEFQII